MSRGRSRARRIAFLDSFPRMGGAERSLVELLARLDRTRFAPYFIAAEQGDVSREVEKLGVPVLFCSVPESVSVVSRTSLSLSSLAGVPAHLCRYLSRLAKTIRSVRPHLTYSNSLKDHLASAFLSPVLKKPVVWHLRDFLEARSLRDFVEAVALVTPTHLIANSHFTARQFPRLSRRQGRTEVVYNGMDLDEIDRKRKSPPRGTVPEHDGPVVALVGAICPEKGQETLIRSLPAVVEAIPNVSCWIIGDEIYATSRHPKGFRRDLERQAEELGVAGNIRFLGWREDVITLLDKVDILVCASDPALSTETFGRTVVEAMACGKAVVALARGGPRELVVDGVTGALFQTYSPGKLAEAILRLTRDKPGTVRMGEAGRKRVERLFTIEQYVHGVESFVGGILEHPGTRA